MQSSFAYIRLSPLHTLILMAAEREMLRDELWPVCLLKTPSLPAKRKAATEVMLNSRRFYPGAVYSSFTKEGTEMWLFLLVVEVTTVTSKNLQLVLH